MKESICLALMIVESGILSVCLLKYFVEPHGIDTPWGVAAAGWSLSLVITLVLLSLI